MDTLKTDNRLSCWKGKKKKSQSKRTISIHDESWFFSPSAQEPILSVMCPLAKHDAAYSIGRRDGVASQLQFKWLQIHPIWATFIPAPLLTHVDGDLDDAGNVRAEL